MKNIAILIFIITGNFTSFAQYDTTAPYLKKKMIPDFSLLAIDSTVFTQSILKENRNTIFMLFHPECDHCQKQLELMLAMPQLEQSVELVLISGEEPLFKNRAFYNTNHLERFPYVHLGKDYKYFFGRFFQPNTVPILAFYNKKGEFVIMNRGDTKKKMILDAIKDN